MLWDDLPRAPHKRRSGGTPDTQFPGGYRSRVTPVPIPNTEVKPATADGTARVTAWESRSLPGLFSGPHQQPPSADAAFFFVLALSRRLVAYYPDGRVDKRSARERCEAENRSDWISRTGRGAQPGNHHDAVSHRPALETPTRFLQLRDKVRRQGFRRQGCFEPRCGLNLVDAAA